MSTQPSLIGDLEGAIQNGSDEKRLNTLRKITDLFLHSSDRLSEDQVAVFDGVIGQLIKRVEDRALVELSERLATVENSPLDVIKRLANDDQIAIAGPVRRSLRAWQPPTSSTSRTPRARSICSRSPAAVISRRC